MAGHNVPEQGAGDGGHPGTAKPRAVPDSHTHITHTQVPGVQLNLLLQLHQELVVEGLELQGERKHTVLVEGWQSLPGEQQMAPGMALEQGCTG